ncbi:MAG: hypothetical protein ISR55_01225 [Bacteroidetes bacterium]|nr:hypothetical protein [Bacteroidota bacterium]
MNSIYVYRIFIIFFLFSTQLFAGQVDTSKIIFKGKEIRIRYTHNRQIKEAPFFIENKTGRSVKVKLKGAYLVRGKHYDPLAKPKIRLYYHNKMRKIEELTIPPNGKFNFNLVFKSFTIYTGSTYTVMCVLLVNGRKMEAFTPMTMFKLEQTDKNKLKNTEQK